MTQSSKTIILIVLILFFGGLYYFTLPPAGEVDLVSNVDSEIVTSTAEGGDQEATVTKSKPTTPSVTPPTSAPSAGVASSFVLIPSAGESWTLGKSHEIRWNKNSGTPGSIALVNAATDSIVGWIAPSITAREVAYNWDTSGVQLTQTNPAKKNVTPGTYYIRIIFSGGKTDIRSDNFNLISGENENILSTKIKIANRLFSPNFVSLKKGEKVIIINDNQNDNETILMGGVAIEVLSPRHSYLIDTSKMSPGEVEVRLASNAIANLTLSIK